MDVKEEIVLKKAYEKPEMMVLTVNAKEAFSAYCYSVSSGFEVTGSCTATSIIEPYNNYQCWRNDMGPNG